LPALGPDVFIGAVGHASLHSVDRTDKYCQLHFSTEGVKPGVGVEGVLIVTRCAIAKRVPVWGREILLVINIY